MAKNTNETQKELNKPNKQDQPQPPNANNTFTSPITNPFNDPQNQSLLAPQPPVDNNIPTLTSLLRGNNSTIPTPTATTPVPTQVKSFSPTNPFAQPQAPKQHNEAPTTTNNLPPLSNPPLFVPASQFSSNNHQQNQSNNNDQSNNDSHGNNSYEDEYENSSEDPDEDSYDVNAHSNLSSQTGVEESDVTDKKPSTKQKVMKHAKDAKKTIGKALNAVVGRRKLNNQELAEQLAKEIASGKQPIHSKKSHKTHNKTKGKAFLQGVAGVAISAGTGGVAPLAYGAYKAYKNRGAIGKFIAGKKPGSQTTRQAAIQANRDLIAPSMAGAAYALTTAKGMAIKKTINVAQRARRTIGTVLQGTQNERNKHKSLAVRATKALVPKELRKPIDVVKTTITKKLGSGKKTP